MEWTVTALGGWICFVIAVAVCVDIERQRRTGYLVLSHVLSAKTGVSASELRHVTRGSSGMLFTVLSTLEERGLIRSYLLPDTIERRAGYPIRYYVLVTKRDKT